MSNYDMIRYERGQVWMIRFLNKNESNGHEQMKDRPWLILSTGKFNKSSGMVTAVPITTRDSVRTPSQVLFNNATNKENVIMCENIRTFDYTSNAYVFDFMGVLSDEILEKVDVALSTHLGMHYSPLSLKKLNDAVDAIINSASSMSNNNRNAKFTDDDVLEFATKLQTLAEVTTPKSTKIPETNCLSSSTSVSNVVKSPVPPSNTVSVIVKKDATEIAVPTEKSENSSTESKKRGKWTPELCRQYLEDVDNLPLTEVMKKWNLSKKPRVYSTKFYVQSILNQTK